MAVFRWFLAVLSSSVPLILRLGREYIQLAIVVVIKVLSTLMAPFGMNQLLRYAFCLIASMDITQPSPSSYLETHGEGAVVRPWVWVSFLFLGPALGTIAQQWYYFIVVSDRGY